MARGGEPTPTYLDYAAATPLDERVLAAMLEASKNFYNPSAIYLAAHDARDELQDYRARVAACVGANSSEIIFTAGASEANNLAINGALQAYGGKALVSAVEHEAVMRPVEGVSAIIPVDKFGVVNLEKLTKLINDDVTLISVMFVSNELGTIQPLRGISALIQEVRRDRKSRGVKQPLLLHTDASQAAGFLDLFVSRLGVDLMTLNGAKIYGPKQSGCLFIKAGVVLKPQILGGGQEFGMRSGTESLMNAAGLTNALELAVKSQNSERERLKKLRDLAWSGIENLGVDAEKLGHPNKVAPHILSVRLPGIDNERLVMELDEAGFQVAAGSACKASSEEPSAVLKAIGLTDEQAGEVIRISFGRQTKETDIRRLVDALAKLLRP